MGRRNKEYDNLPDPDWNMIDAIGEWVASLTWKKIIMWGVIAFLIISFFASIRIIQPGFVGVRVVLGTAMNTQIDEGIHFVFPYITHVYPVDTRVQKFTVKNSAASKDLQTVSATIVINHHLKADKVVALFREVGTAYEEKIISPRLDDVYKASTALFAAEALITERQQVSEKIKTALSADLAQRGIELSQVNITDFEFSAKFNQSIEEKVVAEQEAQKAENQLKRIKIEAQQAEERAKGEALAILEKAKAETESLRMKKEVATPELIMLTLTEKWTGIAPTTLVVGEGLTPVLPVK